MIVVVTHNGWDYLFKCVDSILNSDGKDHKILAVDTCSSDLEFSKKAAEFCEEKGILYGRLEHKHYELGALKYAYSNFPNEDQYWCQQESLFVKHPDTFKTIFSSLNKHEVISWLLFPRSYCAFTNETERQLILNWGLTDQYTLGIYGSNFAIKRSKLTPFEEIINRINVVDKIGSQAMERAWSIMFQGAGYSLATLEDNLLQSWHERDHDLYKYFTKAKHKHGSRQ